MQGCKTLATIAALFLAALACGCQTSGARGSAGGPSPSFGWVPPQSEPPIEDSAPAAHAAAGSRPGGDDVDSDTTASKSNRLAGLLSGRDKEPPQRRTLPVSSDRPGMVDDDEFERE
jgi:hypothetical protein